MIFLGRFHTFIKQYALFEPHDSVLLAVSGGRDSVLMVHLFKLAGFKFGIAHCNFGLRELESDADELFTSNLAKQLDVPFFSTRFNTKRYASTHGISIQMAARDLRYQWLEEIRADFDFQYIALAHHQNDTIETMLLNLTRGTGIAGLHGILPKRNKLIRPLLYLTRDKINEMVNKEGVLYRDDASNQSTKYARNKIRLEVIPKLKELNPNLEETFELNRRRFQELEILLQNRLSDLKSQLFKKVNEDEFQIKLLELKNLIPQNTLIYGLFHPFGFSETVLLDLISCWNGQPGKIFESATHTLLLDREYLILSLKKSKKLDDVEISISDAQIVWNNQVFVVHNLPIESFNLKNNPEIAQLDADLLVFPLIIRTWKTGDYFYPFGMKVKKKLSDFFVSLKIPLTEKEKIGILQNGNGDIIWISGHRIDERYKVTAGTKKVFIFEQQSTHGK